MTKKQQRSSHERMQALVVKIEKAKAEYERLQQKQLTDIGKLAVRFGLHELSQAELEKIFENITQEMLP